ncbi:hypothetical protein Tco_1495974, partial [Tanacetum coccineum]
ALENEKASLETRLAQADADRHQLVQEFIPIVYPYIQKVAESCHLPIADLMKVSPDVPPSTNEAWTSTADETDGAANRYPPPVQKTVADAPFGTTT